MHRTSSVVSLETIPAREQQAALQAAENYVYERFADLTRTSVEHEFREEELERLETEDDDYHLVYTIERLEIKIVELEDDLTLYYISATLIFQVTSGDPIEGTTDLYECYRGTDRQWCIQWHSS